MHVPGDINRFCKHRPTFAVMLGERSVLRALVQKAVVVDACGSYNPTYARKLGKYDYELGL